MKVEHVNPFVFATLNTLKTMLGLEAERGELSLKKVDTTTADLTAIIGLSGKLKGSIVLAFENDVAFQMVRRFMGMPDDADLSLEEVSDAIGELCNIVGGSAKVELNKLDLNLSISVPNVIVGKGLRIMNNASYPTLVFPFKTEVGKFEIEICLMN